MLNIFEVAETNKMIEKENLDVRTITLGISLLDCIDSDLGECNRKVYEKITKTAGRLVAVGAEIEKEFGIPIACSICFMTGTCSRSSVGIGFLVPLYSV